MCSPRHFRNMLRRQQRLLAPALRRAKSSAAAAVDGVAAALTRITVHTTELQLGGSDGTEGRFHTLWLRDNCESNRHASSRQKLRGAASLLEDTPVDPMLNRQGLGLVYCQRVGRHQREL